MSGFPLSRTMSAASAAYALYALARPSHLGRALGSTPESKYDTTARVFGVRDLATSAVALLAPSTAAVTGAMASRIAFDVGDCLVLRGPAGDAATRRKLTGITLGWAALNAGSLLADRLRDKAR